MEFEFVVIIDDLMPDTMRFTFDDSQTAMWFAKMAKKHSDIDALVSIDVVKKGDEEDEDE